MIKKLILIACVFLVSCYFAICLDRSQWLDFSELFATQGFVKILIQVGGIYVLGVFFLIYRSHKRQKLAETGLMENELETHLENDTNRKMMRYLLLIVLVGLGYTAVKTFLDLKSHDRDLLKGLKEEQKKLEQLNPKFFELN